MKEMIHVALPARNLTSLTSDHKVEPAKLDFTKFIAL